MRAQEFIIENADQAAVDALQKKHGWSTGRTSNGDLYFTWQGRTYVFYGERMRITLSNDYDNSVSVVWGMKPNWQGRGNNELSFAQAVQRKLLKFDLSIWQQLDRRQINDNQAIQKFKAENERQAREAIAQGVTEDREKFNTDLMKPGFRWSQEINGITYLVRTQWDNMPEVVAKVNNREVGRATFIDHHTRSGLESVSTYVSPKWQGHGIAKNMYAVVRMLGANIQPSATQTAMGKDMWAKWEKQGDAGHVKNLNPRIKEQTVTEGKLSVDVPNEEWLQDKIEYAIERYTNEANRLTHVLDKQLAQSKFVACDEYTIADMAIFPWMRGADSRGIDMNEYPNVKRWFDSINARPAVQRALQVLSNESNSNPVDDKAREVMFGKTQFQQR